MLLTLTRRYLAPYRSWLLAIVLLQFVATVAALFLPSINADIIDNGVVTGDTVTGEYASAEATLEALEALGVSYADVVELLERDGVAKFETSWTDLLAGVDAALIKARTS